MAKKKIKKDDEPKTQLGTRISVDLKRRMKVHCARVGIEMGDFIIKAIRERLQRLSK